jgi:Tfp pilus assembly protein PilN
VRPVNLIPPEERRGGGAPARTGPTSYLAVGALAALLLGVSLVVMTGKKIDDRKAELATLQQEKTAAEAQLKGVQSFATLRSVAEQRTATVTSLAKSRFDWVRVMHELSSILPSDVWLVNLTGTVRPDVQVQDGADVPTRAEVTSPAIEIVGCATSQDAVARFVADLQDIDGVTRVGVNSSQRAARSSAGSGAGAGGGGGTGDECRTADFITRFELVAAFDDVPTPAVAQAAPASPPEGAATAAASNSSASPSQAQPAAATQPAAGNTTKVVSK